VEYLQIATQNDFTLLNIMLNPTSRIPGRSDGGVPAIEKTREVELPEEIQYAQGAFVTLENAEEIEDESQDQKYWEAFQEAEERLERKPDSELDAEEDVEGAAEEMDDQAAANNKE
jgi:hypothetical protein